MLLTFSPEKHEYRWNGRLVPSVSQVLKSAGLVDPNRFDQSGKQRGTFVHEAIALMMAGTLDWSSIPDGIAGYLRAAEKFLDRHADGPTPLIEVPSYHEVLGFAGTPDLVYSYDEPVIADFKTGGDLPHYNVQVSAYADMYDARSCELVFLKDDGSFTMRVLNQIDIYRGMNVFRACLVVHNWLQENGGRPDGGS